MIEITVQNERSRNVHMSKVRRKSLRESSSSFRFGKNLILQAVVGLGLGGPRQD